MENTPFTSTKADVAYWQKQLQLQFRKEKKEKEKKTDNQYKLKKAMAIAIGLKKIRRNHMCIFNATSRVKFVNAQTNSWHTQKTYTSLGISCPNAYHNE